jgi:hypothetical protein
MSTNKNLHVYKDKDVLEITLRWFKLKAYFFAFFSIFWIGFLVAWYTIAIGGAAPTFAFLVPLIHVAVGIGIGYYTLCLFLNKTYVDIAKGFLTVHHAPIPWWKGNKTIPIKDIDQLYVKEKVTRGKNGRSYTYALRAKLHDGSDQSILDINHASSEQMQEIEAEIEAYMGINDRPVSNEYTSGRKLGRAAIDRPRRLRRDFSDHILNPVFSADVGSVISIKNTQWKIASITQYDWNDGNSDKLFQLTDDQYSEDYIIIRQIKGLLYAYREQSMSAVQSQSLQFNPEAASPFFRYEQKLYNLSRVLIGKKFLNGIHETIAVKQWLYTADDNQSFIRILDEGGVISYERGEALDPEQIALGLDLNQKTIEDMEMRADDWREEDFV